MFKKHTCKKGAKVEKMINIKNIEKNYGSFNVKIQNLKIENGEFLVLLGESGSGKTTLMNLVSGIDREYKGEILIDGESVEKIIKKGELSMVFQDSLLLPHLTVFENIAFGLKIRKFSKEEIKSRVEEIIKRLELEDLQQRYPSQLSGGQKQRVSIGRALVMKPKLLLMDEPFSALDMKLREKFQKMMKELQKEFNLTTLFVTHDRDEAFYLADKIAIINKGEIEQIDTPTKLYNSPKSDYIAQFLGIENIFFIDKDQEIISLFTDKSGDIAIPSEDLRVVEEGTNISGILKEKIFKTGLYYLEVEIKERIITIRQNRIDFPINIGEKVNVKVREKDIIYIK